MLDPEPVERPAYSPEARGRSERMFGTLQNRLVKELRHGGIRAIERINRWIRDVYLRDSARFANLRRSRRRPL